MSKSTLTELDTGPGLEAWLRSFNVGSRVEGIVVHHTEEPTGAQYHGVSTVAGIRAYHKGLGWSDIGANLYTTPAGTVVTGRPLDAANWSHAAVQRPWAEVDPEARALCHGNPNWPNLHWLGIETIANFDTYDPWGDGPDARSLQATLAGCVTICRVFKVDPATRLFIHRDVACEGKTCPGMRLDRATLRAKVAGLLGGGLGIVLEPDHRLLDCRPQLLNGAIWCDLRPLAEALNARVLWDGHAAALLVAGQTVDISAWAVTPATGPTRGPLRQIVLACGGHVLEPLHLEANPPRVYVSRA